MMKIDNCPSCGSHAALEWQQNDHRIKCTKCGMNTGWCNHSHGASAADSWNMRVETKLDYPALITPPNTPKHLVSVKLFDTDDELSSFWGRNEARHLIKTTAIHLPTFKRLSIK
jgi:hypothetical protein